jgi:hypothetical protein
MTSTAWLALARAPSPLLPGATATSHMAAMVTRKDSV